ncbi:MOG interacting and ectopic P-granules protein 1 [Aplysia californica]|uniref:MOG interacting and ectopic P-granules protein 1 n=1 Tax=Aplysia californica TaxID=6500 RepID=A0ABM1A2P1_APLCA|nr:MOG interacting and ectopic P-granules protein 1 [Aplysia californica]XP_012939629.1 MOG interacting and ectopic P-granules protein 1 [Aplysia californica]XP_012939631.1 MOG interacting and ectopic P-granules protein 1 [Aplysia californica]
MENQMDIDSRNSSPRSLKRKRLSNGTNNSVSNEQSSENGTVCNGSAESETAEEGKEIGDVPKESSNKPVVNGDCHSPGDGKNKDSHKNSEGDASDTADNETSLSDKKSSISSAVSGSSAEEDSETIITDKQAKQISGTSETKSAEDSKTGRCLSEPTAVGEKTEENQVKSKWNGTDKKAADVSVVSNGPSVTVSDKSKSSLPKDEDSMNNDDIEIVGESKVINMNGPFSSSSSPQNVVFVPAAVSNSIATLPLMTQGFQASLFSQNMLPAGRGVAGLMPGHASAGMGSLPSGFMLSSGGLQAQNAVPTSSSNISVMAPAVAPPKPKSSLDQIELIRWEIHNRVNTRPKYFKPNPSSDLGPLAKFLFDIGSDLIKESVYHELVKIQSKKHDEEKLTEKEKEDLEKLKEIEKDLYATIGHLKLKMKKRCKTCHFQTESTNVLYLHKQFPHEENKLLHCSHCKFTSKQPMAYKFHVEAEHNIQPRVYDKKAFYECDMCPYENNQEQKVVLHKQRCLKQFRPHFNLHPSCLSGAEINLCLENIFYKPVVPKNLKLLQQKHAQQQAALAEARRQQAQVQALAAQKNAAAAAAKKQLANQRLPQAIAPRQLQGSQMNRLPSQSRGHQQSMRFNENSVPKGVRPTVANMLNNRQNIPTHGPAQHGSANTAGGFEVCEICGGYVKDRKALRIHFFYAHRIDLPFNLFERTQAPLYCATCYVRFWTAQGLRKHIDTHKEENQTQGVVGKCISCGHQVLNLLLHMRIVHNREIQHYINALMCMFCGSHFGSRAEVERHIKFIHGNIDPISGAIKGKGSPSVQSSPQQSQKGSSKRSGNSAPLKGSVCVLCNLNFGRNVDLTRHCMRMHHTCMKCGMVVIDKASLMKHTCLSSPSGTRNCAMCEETGFHPAYFVKHLRDKHLKKFSIKIARLSKNTIERWTKRPFNVQEPEKVLVEISDSSDDECGSDKPSVTPPLVVTKHGKRPRMGPASFIKKYREKLEAEKIRDAEVVKIDDDNEEIAAGPKTEDKDRETENASESERKGALDVGEPKKSPGPKRKMGPLSSYERAAKRKRSA